MCLLVFFNNLSGASPFSLLDSLLDRESSKDCSSNFLEHLTCLDKLTKVFPQFWHVCLLACGKGVLKILDTSPGKPELLRVLRAEDLEQSLSIESSSVFRLTLYCDSITEATSDTLDSASTNALRTSSVTAVKSL